MLTEPSAAGCPAVDPGEPPVPLARLTPQRCEQWAHVIHDEVLQSLGLSILQADICRRLWETGREEQALAELQGVSQEIDAAVDVLRRVVTELVAAARAEPFRA